MEEDLELKDALLAFYKAAESGDASFLRDNTSAEPGVVFIGTDPDEWWEGRDTLAKAVAAQHDQVPDLRLTPGEVRAYREGDVGWVFDQPTIRLPDGGESNWRITAVFRRETDTWKLVHGHSSVGVPNEEVVGRELTV